MNGDALKTQEWHNSVLTLLKKLPQYNEKDFAFQIDTGLKLNPVREQFYFVKDNKYCNYFYDRQDVYKKSTKKLEEAVYWILERLIFNFAIEYEKNNRIKYIDGRRNWFKLTQEMFDIIGEPYSKLKQQEQAKILKQAPFEDAPTCRLDLVKDYAEITNWIKQSSYNKYLPNLTSLNRLITYHQSAGGIPDFENLFKYARQDLTNFNSFLIDNNEQPTEFFKLFDHTEKIAKKYLD